MYINYMTEDTFPPNRCERRELIAYLAGLVASDGHLPKEGKYCIIYTKNLEFVKFLAELFSQLTSEVAIKQKGKEYCVILHNSSIYHTLVDGFKIPIGKKADKLHVINVSSEEEVKAFIRGFCDGDSTIHTRKMRNKRVPRIRIMSICKEFLTWLREQLISLGIRCGKPFIDKPHGKIAIKYDCKPCWRIEIYGNNVEKFKQIIGYFHPEKKKKIEEVCKLLHTAPWRGSTQGVGRAVQSDSTPRILPGPTAG